MLSGEFTVLWTLRCELPDRTKDFVYFSSSSPSSNIYEPQRRRLTSRLVLLSQTHCFYSFFLMYVLLCRCFYSIFHLFFDNKKSFSAFSQFSFFFFNPESSKDKVLKSNMSNRLSSVFVYSCSQRINPTGFEICVSE